ncbi:hypothetical protein [Paracoccus alkenifer]|uniref:Uncharacterized protein n=1 Tax=Paracoccus alkenifer TaxID=65735 RepID=A0A1H6MZ84_9RHOB|nr:hypothetical protein [Paracoccus alkenifer]SEI03424.1 hypothetical protein SAMN04488075_2331 [Paracoccus alkenifer]
MPEDIQPAPDDRIHFRLSSIDRGTVATVNVGSRSASFLAGTALSQHPKFGPIIKPLDGIVAASLERLAARNLDGYTGPALEREVSTELARIRPALLAAIAGVREIRSNHQLRKARTLDFNREVNASLRSDLRRFWAGHDSPQRLKLAIDGDWLLLSALIESGQDFSGLSNELWNQVETRFMILNHVKIAGLDSSHVIPSTTEYLTGAGTDHAAAFKTAEQAVRAWEVESDLLDLAEDYFQALVRALMLVSNKSATEIAGLPV